VAVDTAFVMVDDNSPTHIQFAWLTRNGRTLSEAPMRKTRRISLKLALSIEPFEGMPLRRRSYGI